jgi:hypothetical protein
MSGTQIVPEEIPGTDVVPEEIAAAAEAYRTASTAIGEKSAALVSHWSGISAVYSAPEAPELLAAMNPVAVDTEAIATRLTSVAGFLETMAESVAAPVKRLKELKLEAQAFVDSVRGGVTVGPYDIDNPMFQASAMSGSPTIVPEGTGNHTLDWAEHTPSVARNNQLLEEVNAQIERIMVARADCVNGLNGLREDVCVVPAETVTAEQLDASTGLDWGTQGKGDRSFNESMSDGLYSFVEGAVVGLTSLVGVEMEDEPSWTRETAGAAWGGLFQGLGALAITGPPMFALMMTPEKSVPVPLKGLRDWYTVQATGIVGGMVGTPEQWEEDPVAAGTFAVLSLGTIVVPGAGLAGAGAKGAGALGNGSNSLVRGASGLGNAALAATRTRLANGLNNAAHFHTTFSASVRSTFTRGTDVQKTVDDLDALDAFDDVKPNGPFDGPTIDADSPSHPTDIPPASARPDTDSDSPEGGSDSPIAADTQRSIAMYERLAERYPKLANMFEGSIFNLENAHRYDYNEITLDVKIENPDGTPAGTRRTRVDSYTPYDAVVSRKNTQLAEVNYSTAKHYIDEFRKNYMAKDARFTIADTDKNKLVMPERIGDPLLGPMYLEVPEQVRPIPQSIVEYAAEKGITIRIAPTQ